MSLPVLLIDRGTLGPWFVVDGERVRSVGLGETLPDTSPRLDAAFDPAAVLTPGAVDAHTHLYSALVPLGMPPPPRQPMNFVEILELVWWRLDRAIDAPILRAAARLYVAESLLAGTTTLVDHHESPGFIEGSLDVVADAAETLGARMLVTYGATERNGGAAEGLRGLAECERFIRRGSSRRVRGLVGLHASFTVGDDTVRKAGDLCRDLGVGLHVHVAEDGADVADARRRGYAGPVERLDALGALVPGSILAHGVHLGEASVRRADEAGAWLVQNPRSNANNRVGYPRALHASRRVAVGTDGFPAEMDVEHASLADEAARHRDPASPDVLAARTRGAHELVAEHFVGRFGGPVDDGAASDFVVGVPNQRPRHVVVGGRVVVRDGRLTGGDLDAIRDEAREQAARLWKRMA